MSRRGAHVEIVDPKSTDGYPLVPTQVLINGVDVGFVAKDGVRIDPGGSASLTQVTLTLLPGRLTIRGADEAAAPLSETKSLLQALRKAAAALAFSFGGVTPDQCESPEDRAMCEAMHEAYRVLGEHGRATAARA